jgi:hypothetical protein
LHASFFQQDKRNKENNLSDEMAMKYGGKKKLRCEVLENM